jgi:hypothetical protein
MVLMEDGTEIGGIPAQPSAMPDLRVAPGGVAVLTRCEDYGKVRLTVWAGDPGPSSDDWSVVFDGRLVTVSRGFSAGTATATAFEVKAPPGTYRVRTEIRRDGNGDVDAVRFIFPESPNLAGEINP